jgi:hypothetical protein
MADARLQTHVEDAWQYVQRAIESGTKYDIIIVDLTVAQDLAGARFHSIDWYEMLAQVLQPNGVLATNSVSPCATPEAYFCIFNGIRTAGLHAVPYRVCVPSFTSLGYGPDWGFILASGDGSIVEALRGDLEIAEDRHAVVDCEHLRKLFVFPIEVFEYQEESSPAGTDSEVFLHYLYNADDVTVTSGQTWNALQADLDDLELPDPDVGGKILPASIRALLAGENGEETLLYRVLEMIPAMNRFQTRRIVAEFIENPAVFLESIDLVGLVEELLQRAAELPEKIVSELKLLQERLVDWAGDHLSLMQLGGRITSIVAVVVILGNLIYPDSVYGKGEHAGDHAARAHAADHNYGHNSRGVNHDWNHNDFGHHYDHWGHWNDWGGHYGHWGGWARPWHRWWGGGWGGWVGWAPWAGWGLPVASGVNVNINSVDEQGNQYPLRSYNNNAAYVSSYGTGSIPPVVSASEAPTGAPAATASEKGIYRLGPDTDVLPDGKVTMQLTNGAYLVVGSTGTTVVDQANGVPLMALYSDPSLQWHLNNELGRQQKRLESSIQSKQGAMDSSDSLGFQKMSDQSQGDLAYMKKMDGLLGTAQQKFTNMPEQAPPPEKAPVEGAMEVFTSVWMTPDGKWLLIKRADGSVAYMDGKGWYSDEGKTRLAAPYPEKFKTVVTGYLTNLTKEASSATASITQDKQEAQQRMQKLQQDMQNLLPPEHATAVTPTSAMPAPVTASSDVQFGPETVKQPEALRRTKLSIRRAQHRLDFLNKELESIPTESAAATKMLATLNS